MTHNTLLNVADYCPLLSELKINHTSPFSRINKDINIIKSPRVTDIWIHKDVFGGGFIQVNSRLGIWSLSSVEPDSATVCLVMTLSLLTFLRLSFLMGKMRKLDGTSGLQIISYLWRIS